MQKGYLLKLPQELEGAVVRDNGWGGEFMYNIFDTL
jgi:hypothetical protein